ncbi:MAG: hypothetical protein Harvfovirus2_26 [Harvfovirus sp.]|uniref:Uncharacterized protein n=1 Tax=Harvfovirus sp. TaxID=2487768 RepID=A0A3G4ZZT9_9VIRU|nr:MAG: hypothetical protein Harvfovirus2_26 [Harvfovirus sp.]
MDPSIIYIFQLFMKNLILEQVIISIELSSANNPMEPHASLLLAVLLPQTDKLNLLVANPLPDNPPFFTSLLTFCFSRKNVKHTTETQKYFEQYPLIRDLFKLPVNEACALTKLQIIISKLRQFEKLCYEDLLDRAASDKKVDVFRYLLAITEQIHSKNLPYLQLIFGSAVNTQNFAIVHELAPQMPISWLCRKLNDTISLALTETMMIQLLLFLKDKPMVGCNDVLKYLENTSNITVCLKIENLGFPLESIPHFNMKSYEKRKIELRRQFRNHIATAALLTVVFSYC